MCRVIIVAAISFFSLTQTSAQYDDWTIETVTGKSFSGVTFLELRGDSLTVFWHGSQEQAIVINAISEISRTKKPTKTVVPLLGSIGDQV